MADTILARDLVPGDIFTFHNRPDSGVKKVLTARPYNQGSHYVIVQYESLSRGGSGGNTQLRRDTPVAKLSYIEPLGVLDLIQRSTTPSHLTVFNTREGFYA